MSDVCDRCGVETDRERIEGLPLFCVLCIGRIAQRRASRNESGTIKMLADEVEKLRKRVSELEDEMRERNEIALERSR